MDILNSRSEQPYVFFTELLGSLVVLDWLLSNSGSLVGEVICPHGATQTKHWPHLTSDFALRERRTYLIRDNDLHGGRAGFVVVTSVYLKMPSSLLFSLARMR